MKREGLRVKGDMVVSCKGCGQEFSLHKLIRGVRRGEVTCSQCGTRICKVN